eukprot:TRINITY_DN44654_c0_g1_i1.p1 TRINITY_DN44654_c0_g1~~TRINITY_DN44654_c0_g1_i1.p1  ORF type:complete len:288 (+),score=23.85 TRINITY_DN44654_c0_g1_i1:34-897(+)
MLPIASTTQSRPSGSPSPKCRVPRPHARGASAAGIDIAMANLRIQKIVDTCVLDVTFIQPLCDAMTKGHVELEGATVGGKLVDIVAITPFFCKTIGRVFLLTFLLSVSDLQPNDIVQLLTYDAMAGQHLLHMFTQISRSAKLVARLCIPVVLEAVFRKRGELIVRQPIGKTESGRRHGFAVSKGPIGSQWAVTCPSMLTGGGALCRVMHRATDTNVPVQEASFVTRSWTCRTTSRISVRIFSSTRGARRSMCTHSSKNSPNMALSQCPPSSLRLRRSMRSLMRRSKS